MWRGFILFKCTCCSHKFTAPDIEFMATFYSTPQKCPNCGSIRTRPAGLFGWLHQGVYKAIWKSAETNNEQ